MFKLGDKVKLKEKTYGALDLYDLFDEIGVIKHIHTKVNDVAYQETLTVKYPLETLLTLDAQAFTVVEDSSQPLTIMQIQQLKEQLALDLLKLIQVYEETTQTHIASVHPLTQTFEGDGTTVQRITGVRLEVNL